MDQTAVFTTLIGGMLAIVGGFLGTYFTQIITNRAEKKKITLEKVEELYSLIIGLDNKVNNYFGDLWALTINKGGNKEAVIIASGIIKETLPYKNNIEMLSRLYVKSVRSLVDEYLKLSNEMINGLCHDIENEISLKEIVTITNKRVRHLTNTESQLKETLTKLISDSK